MWFHLWPACPSILHHLLIDSFISSSVVLLFSRDKKQTQRGRVWITAACYRSLLLIGKQLNEHSAGHHTKPQRVPQDKCFSRDWQGRNRRPVDTGVQSGAGSMDLLILSLDWRCENNDALNASAGMGPARWGPLGDEEEKGRTGCLFLLEEEGFPTWSPWPPPWGKYGQWRGWFQSRFLEVNNSWVFKGLAFNRASVLHLFQIDLWFQCWSRSCQTSTLLSRIHDFFCSR